MADETQSATQKTEKPKPDPMVALVVSPGVIKRAPQSQVAEIRRTDPEARPATERDLAIAGGG